MAANDVVDHVTAMGVTAEQRGRAVRAVASSAADAEECAMLLDMLGLPVPQQRQGEVDR